MNKEEKAFYTIDETLVYLKISVLVLARLLIAYNIATTKLVGSEYEYIAAHDVKLIEQSLKEPSPV